MSRQKIESSSRLDIHNIGQDLDACLVTLQSELSPENWKLIEKYNILLSASTISKAARRGTLRILLSLSRLNDQKSWESMTREDIDLLVYKIMEKYSPDGQESWSSRNHKSVLVQFIRWLKLGSRDKDDVGDPSETKGVKIKQPREKITRDALVTEKDLANLMSATPHLQIKALIDSAEEGAERIAELLTLKIRNLQFDENGAIISVDGKTGTRQIRLVRSSKTLLNWYNAHPAKQDPDAWLFVGWNKNTSKTRLKYSTARYHIVEAAKRGKVNKRIYFHLLRHTGATNAANYMTEAQMRKRHGWSKSSPMPGRYVHLVNADVESAVLAHHGLAAKTQIQSIQKCPTCDWLNSPDAGKCEKCEKPLDVKTAIKMDEDRQKSIEKIVEDKVLALLQANADKELLKIKTEELEKKIKALQKPKN